MNMFSKKLKVLATGLLMAAGMNSQAQISNASYSERFGNTLNLAVGRPYFFDWGVAPYFTANYEFLVSPNFTLAPFAGMVSYRRGYFMGSSWEDYRQRLLLVGAKGTYYFDDLLGLGPSWDIYAAFSLGYVSSSVTWDARWSGRGSVIKEVGQFYYDLHLGAEYHITRRTGLILDVSRGITTFGVAIHKVPHAPKKRR